MKKRRAMQGKHGTFDLEIRVLKNTAALERRSKKMVSRLDLVFYTLTNFYITSKQQSIYQFDHE